MLPLLAMAAGLVIFAVALILMGRHFRMVEQANYRAWRTAQAASDARKRAACTSPVPALPAR